MLEGLQRKFRVSQTFFQICIDVYDRLEKKIPTQEFVRTAISRWLEDEAEELSEDAKKVSEIVFTFLS